MNSSWIKSPTGRRVLEHWADSRPTWLWSADGQMLAWRNRAALLFNGNSRRGGGAGEVVPLKGQIARLIRLGSPNRASLSRMQFLADDRPVSATCSCMPLTLPDGQPALLVVTVDPVDAKELSRLSAPDPAAEALLPPGTDYLLVDDKGRIANGSAAAKAELAPLIEAGGLPSFDAEGNGRIETENGPLPLVCLKASPKGAHLLLVDLPPVADLEPGTTTEPAIEPASLAVPEPAGEPMLPLGLPPLPAPPLREVEPAEELPHAGPGALASLFDRLVDDGALFTPLGADEDFEPPAPAQSEDISAPEAGPPPIEADEERLPAALMEAAGPLAPEPSELPTAAVAPAPEEPADNPDEPALATAGKTGPEDAEPDNLYRVIARRFIALDTEEASAAPEASPNAETPAEFTEPPTPLPETAAGEATAEIAPGSETPAPPSAADQLTGPTPDAENVERVSRYNFDELSRILNDRIGNGEAEAARAAVFGTRIPATVPSATPTGALVTLGGETLVLNRLPLGILVFREQQILFANRAITSMTGYDSVEALRAAGLAGIFPAGNEAQEAGPVNHLVQRDGMLVPVTARLQSVSWQGKPALMLSASATEVRTGHEAAVKAFAEHLAGARADGFLETSRAGIIAYVSGDARLLLQRQEEQLLGRPVSTLAAPDEVPALKEFLERPARFAETARPAMTIKGIDPGIEIMLFALGQAGMVGGYFGFVRRTAASELPALAAPSGGDGDPALLTRLSRGVRRPLNTVIGFSDLIASSAFGAVENQRYVEYARDIKTAGLEIAALVDELDDFARLRDGRYAAHLTEIDLEVLLDSIVARVRGQANAARVLVRSAISERLPRVRADRASLAQAILNLLASAIDQTPQDGSVVLSAQPDEDGGVAINVRDSAHNIVDLGERFVVFRDGIGRDGETLAPIRSSVGLALTRALLAVNQANLNVAPAGSVGTLFSLTIPPANILLAPPQPTGTPGES